KVGGSAVFWGGHHPTTARASGTLLPRHRRQDAFAEVAYRAREDAGVAGTGAHHKSALDADHHVFGAVPRHRPRQPGLDAERLDGIDPGAERAAERTGETPGVDAGAQALEQAGSFPAFVERVDRIEHAIEFLS